MAPRRPDRADIVATVVGVLAALALTWGVKEIISRQRIDERVEAMTKSWPLDATSKQRLGRAWERSMRPVLASARYEEYLEQRRTGSPQLGSRGGLARLTDAELAQYQLLKRRLAEVSERACACELAAQRCTQAEHLQALSLLSDAEVDAWYRLWARAKLAELEATAPLPSFLGDYQQGLDAIVEPLSAVDGDRLRAALAGRVTEPAERCQALRSLYGGLDALDPQRRARFTRAMASAVGRR
jgi:hypothetical protein